MQSETNKMLDVRAGEEAGDWCAWSGPRMNEGVGMKVRFRPRRGPGLDGPGGGKGRVVVSYW